MAVELGSTSLGSDANLKGYYKLENVNDSSSSSYNLTNNGTTTFVAGKYNNGGSFNGSNQWLDIAHASCPNLETISDQTWTAWIKPTDLGLYTIMAKTAAASGKDVQITGAGGLIALRSYKGGDDQSVTSSNAVTAGAWNFVAAVYTASGFAVSLFVNGTKSTGTYSRAMVADTNPFAIGRLGGLSAQYFKGLIDDVGYFNRALSDADIEKIYLGTPAATGTGYSASQGWF